MPLEFIECTHTYLLDGVEVPSVTQILGNCGISDVSGIPADKLAFAAARGTAVHRFCQFLDEDDADWSQIEGTILEPYCRAYAQFKTDAGFAPVAIEHQFCTGSYAGTIDRVGRIGGELAILDLKTASAPSRSWAIQTAAYAAGYMPNAHLRRAALRLRKDASYKLIRHDDRRDFDVWEAALRLELWKRAKAKRGRKKTEPKV